MRCPRLSKRACVRVARRAKEAKLSLVWLAHQREASGQLSRTCSGRGDGELRVRYGTAPLHFGKCRAYQPPPLSISSLPCLLPMPHPAHASSGPIPCPDVAPQNPQKQARSKEIVVASKVKEKSSIDVLWHLQARHLARKEVSNRSDARSSGGCGRTVVASLEDRGLRMQERVRAYVGSVRRIGRGGTVGLQVEGGTMCAVARIARVLGFCRVEQAGRCRSCKGTKRVRFARIFGQRGSARKREQGKRFWCLVMQWTIDGLTL